MSEMQDKILGAIEKVATKHGVEAVKRGQWANTGAIFLQPVEGFDHILTIFYDFQDTYFSLHLVGDVVGEFAESVSAFRLTADGRYPTLRYSAPGAMSGASCHRDAMAGHAFWLPGRYDNGAEITYVLGIIGELIDHTTT